MEKLFKPKTIALVGASNEKGKISNTIMQNLLSYKGKIFPINIKEKKVLGKKAYKSILDVKENIDLTIIAVPKKYVAKVLEEAGKKKTKFAVIISAGFKETGDLESETELIKIAKKYNIRIIGPNVLGIIDNYTGLDCLFLPKELERRPKKGFISILSQSGTVGAGIVDLMSERQIGLNKFISYGNASDLNETDFLEFLGKDKNTKVIVGYIEQIKDGERFFKVAKKIKKPIILLKAGLTEKGQKAVQSHTGALAGDKEIYKGILKQLNIIQAYSVKDLLDFANIFALKKIKDVCIITNGGGYGILLTDQLSINKVKLTKLTEKTKKNLKKHLPLGVSVNNPIDLMGDADADRYLKAIKLTKKEVNTYIIVLLGQTPKINKKEVEKIIKVIKKEKINVVFLSTYKPYTKMLENHFIVYEWPNTLAKSIAKNLL